MSATPTPARDSSEAGFTLTEMMIVLVIIAILMAVAIPSYLSAKRAAHYKDAVSAASSYRQAISSYQLDNGNLVPIVGIPTIWKSVAGKPDPMGPINLLRAYYLRSGAPSEVAHGTLLVYGGSVGTSVPAAPLGATTAQIAAVQIAFPSPTTYQLGVWTRKNATSPWTLRCEIANTAVPTALNC